MSKRTARPITALIPTALLCGCIVVPPSPAVETASLLSTAVVAAASVLPNDPQNAYVHPHPRIRSVCIEFNPTVALAEFVPAVQRELRENGVDSRLYPVGLQPGNCPATLSYSAFIEWDRRAFRDDYDAYLTFAALTLRANGQVVASANYEMGQTGLDKWTSTRSKIAGVVKALLAGN